MDWANILTTVAFLIVTGCYIFQHFTVRRLLKENGSLLDERRALLDHIDRLMHPERHPELHAEYDGVPDGGILIPPGGSATIRMRIPIERPTEEKHDG